jgi:hypothetical protein
MEPEVPMLCSQEPSTGPYPDPNELNPYSRFLFYPPTNFSMLATYHAHIAFLDLKIIISKDY